MTLDGKMSKAELLKYVRGVARSIEANIERLKDHDDEKVIKRIADGINKFYVSLFDRKGGTYRMIYLNNVTRYSVINYHLLERTKIFLSFFFHLQECSKVTI